MSARHSLTLPQLTPTIITLALLSQSFPASLAHFIKTHSKQMSFNLRSVAKPGNILKQSGQIRPLGYRGLKQGFQVSSRVQGLRTGGLDGQACRQTFGIDLSQQ